MRGVCWVLVLDRAFIGPHCVPLRARGLVPAGHPLTRTVLVTDHAAFKGTLHPARAQLCFAWPPYPHPSLGCILFGAHPCVCWLALSCSDADVSLTRALAADPYATPSDPTVHVLVCLRWA